MQHKGKKVLVLGGTGAMGTYLVPLLADMGCQVHVVALDKKDDVPPNIRYEQANAMDDDYLRKILQNDYDAIVDFLIYPTKHFAVRYKLLLENTSHYIYLSSYRVYADSQGPITETSPQLLDVSDNEHFLSTDDYSLAKARQEDILEQSGFDNWTVVRPAITFSKLKYQLVTLEANIVVARAMQKRPIVLPRDALSIQGTMTWAGDVARMLARLLFNPVAYREAYTVSTAEHHPWAEIAGYYHDLIGLEYAAVDTQTYLEILGSPDLKSPRSYQLHYDRYFNRIVDNSKILQATGLKQADLMPLKQGLARELAELPPGTTWNEDPGTQSRMDAYLATLGDKRA